MLDNGLSGCLVPDGPPAGPCSASSLPPARGHEDAAARGTTAPAGETARRVRILLVNGHPVVRQGLTRLISGEPDLAVCAEAGDAAEALKAIEVAEPDMLILEISLRGVRGIELLKDLKVRHPALPVLVFSSLDGTLFAERALRAGATGYIMKDKGRKELMSAIRKVSRREIYVSGRVGSRILQAAVRGQGVTDGSPMERLSDRELEIFVLIGRGFGTREVANMLHRSPKTIESHRASIKDKLMLKTATELLMQAIQWVQSNGTS